MKKLILAPVCLFGILACASVAPDLRKPAQAFEPNTPYSTASVYEDASDAPLLMAAVMQNDPEKKQQVATEIRTLIQEAAFAQQLSSSFDLLLDLKLVEQSKRGQATFTHDTEMHCKLWESSAVQESLERRLREFQAEVVKANDVATYAWFLRHFESTKADTAAQIIAKAQLVRLLRGEHDELCAGRACPAFTRFAGPPAAAFDPMDDAGMLAFKNKFLKKIAIYTLAELGKLKTGNCFEAKAAREPNSADGYDWKHRNKTGLSLPVGQYIFTYDDGPHPKYSIAMADAWKDSGLPQPTFFWLAQNVLRYPKLVDEIHDRGLEINVHSFDHPDMGNLAKAVDAAHISRANRPLFAKELKTVAPEDFEAWRIKTLDKEILEAYDIISKAVGESPRITKFRLPYGSGVRNPLIGERFQKLDVNHYFWAIDSLDWQDKNPASIVERVHKQMKLVKRGMILIHDIHPQSVEASKLLIKEFQAGENGTVVNLNAAHL